MSVFMRILGIASLVLLACTIICGLWIRKNPIDDKSFHFALSLASVILSFVTILLFMIVKR